MSLRIRSQSVFSSITYVCIITWHSIVYFVFLFNFFQTNFSYKNYDFQPSNMYAKCWYALMLHIFVLKLISSPFKSRQYTPIHILVQCYIIYLIVIVFISVKVLTSRKVFEQFVCLKFDVFSMSIEYVYGPSGCRSNYCPGQVKMIVDKWNVILWLRTSEKIS